MSRPAALVVAALAAAHLLALTPELVAPHPPALQHREFPLAPPTKIRWVDAEGRIRLRPFVYPLLAADRPGESAREDLSAAPRPIRWFSRAASRPMPGAARPLRYIAVEPPARLFLLGTDELGRDQLSRLIHGARRTLYLSAGAAALTLLVGFGVGVLVGLAPRSLDWPIERLVDATLAVPWFVLLLAARSVLPLDLGSSRVEPALAALLAAVSWPRTARLVRGAVLEARGSAWAATARGLGLPPLRIVLRHFLPQTYGLLAVQGALLVPRFMAAETTLSFVGLGLGEPEPSWGGMLAALGRYHVAESAWWLGLPCLLLIPLFFLYQRLAAAISRSFAES